MKSNKHEETDLQLSNDTLNITLLHSSSQLLKQWSEERKTTPAAIITYLIEQEAERLRLLHLHDAEEYSDNKIQRHSKLKEITELCTASLGNLNHESEMIQVIRALEDLSKVLLTKKMLSTKVDPLSIIDSRRIDVTQPNYYYFAGTLAKYISGWFGTFDLYLNVGIFPDQTVMFIGMPNNVNVSAAVFELLYRLFCQIKSTYKNTFGPKVKGSEKKILTDMHLSRLSQQLEHVRAWIRDEQDFKHLCDYATGRYSYALR